MLYSSLMTSINSSPRGADRKRKNPHTAQTIFSTHYSVRLTSMSLSFALWAIFNNSLHEGPTKQESRCWSEQTFQLTTREGADILSITKTTTRSHFQLTTPRLTSTSCKDLQSSPLQLTTREGPTCNSVEMDFGFDIFNSHLMRGADNGSAGGKHIYVYFQLTTPRGGPTIARKMR